MPGLPEDTRMIMRWLAELSRDTCVNVMDQYRFAWKVLSDPRFSGINRPLRHREFDEAVSAVRAWGLWRLVEPWRSRHGP